MNFSIMVKPPSSILHSVFFRLLHADILSRSLLCAVVCLSLLACTGVPLRSMPKLMQVSKELMEGNPAELMVALQVDSRMVLPTGTAPTLNFVLKPAVPGVFEVIDKKYPLQVVSSTVATQGLQAPSAGRRWLIYSLSTATQQELVRLREQTKGIMEKAKGHGGGSLGLGIGQESLVVTDLALANTRWETWLQTRADDGFFEVWSGTPAQLQKMAK